MIISIIVILVFISVLLSFVSLRHELKRSKHEKKIKEDLARGKVLFYSPSADKPSGGESE